MKRLLSIATGALLALSVVGTAIAASPPGKNSIKCEVDGNATASPSGAQGCVFDVDAGGAAFAYYSTSNGGFFPNAWDKQLDSITQLSFRYSGTDPAGVLRWSIQIDEDGPGPNDPNTNPYVFVGADACNNGSGLVDVIGDQTCTINYGTQTYANWAAFTAAYPDATLYFAFVVADGPWSGALSSVKIGKPGK